MYKGAANNNNSFGTPRENIIKAAIIDNFARKTAKEFIVCNELTFSSHNRIADLIFCKDNKTYAFEIKAWNDDFRRLGHQLDMYCRIFDYIYPAITSYTIYMSPEYLQYTETRTISDTNFTIYESWII